MAFFFAVVSHVDDGRKILLAPYDCIRKAGAQNLDRVRIGGEYLLHHFFLFEDDGLAIYILFPIGGNRALVPPGVAGGMITHHNNHRIRFARQGLRFCNVGPIAVKYVRARYCFFDSLHDAYAVGRCATIPIKQNLICPWTDDRNGLQLCAIQRKYVVLVLEKNDGLVRGLSNEFLARGALPGPKVAVRGTTDICVGIDSGGIQFSQAEMNAQRVLKRGVHIGFGQQAILEGLGQIGCVVIKEPVDAGFY